MLKKKTLTLCVFCEKPASRQISDKLEFFSSKNKEVFLCEKCFQSFSAGSIMGQFQLNNKILSLISNSDDKAPILSLKEKLAEYTPASKTALFSKEIKNTLTITPKDFYEHLNKSVIGQEIAKKRISLTVYEHMKSYSNYSSEKHNILFLGPSGSGKTLIVNSIAKKLDVPYVISDATSFSPTGFQGADSESAIHDLYVKADGDIDVAQHGVVFIDEVDKLASRNTGTRLESFNYSTQSTLLKLIEGKKVKIPKTFLGDTIAADFVDTSKILFCFGGAFNGLEEILAKKKNISGRSIGFRQSDEEDYDVKMRIYDYYNSLSHDVLVESLIEFGMSTELIGRIQTIVPLCPLNKNELLDCLMKLSDSPIIKNKLSFAESNIELDFTEEYYNAVVDKAVKAGTGARALNSIVKTSISVAAFNYLGQKNNHIKILMSDKAIENPQNYEVCEG